MHRGTDFAPEQPIMASGSERLQKHDGVKWRNLLK